MYELIILSLLMRFPLHGYLITKIANGMIGPWAKLSNGTLYPLLNRLEREGLIKRSDGESEDTRGEQSARTYTVTEAGRERFYQLMRDTSSNIGDYQKIFHMKFSYMDLLPPNDRQHLFNHYIRYCQASILHIKSEAEDLEHELAGDDTHGLYKRLILQVMQHRADMWQAEVEWVMHMRKELLAQENEVSTS